MVRFDIYNSLKHVSFIQLNLLQSKPDTICQRKLTTSQTLEEIIIVFTLCRAGQQLIIKTDTKSDMIHNFIFYLIL